MKVLLDHDLPKALRLQLRGHLALTAPQMGWGALSNGRLLAAVEANAFDVLLTGDRAMYSQQNHLDRRIALVVVTDTRLANLLTVIDGLCAAITDFLPGGLAVVDVPRPPKVPKGLPGV